uniref:Uncharacterized protein n=1 Tax=Schistocephalus solidus TaxID=70667 RepID=A0A0X3P3Y4_SCHSO
MFLQYQHPPSLRQAKLELHREQKNTHVNLRFSVFSFIHEKGVFLINRGTFGKQAAVILTPENSNLAKIAVIIVHKDEWFPGLPNVHYVKPIIVSSSYSPPIAVVLDEDIKEIRLLGNISRLESHSHGGGLQIIIPYGKLNSNLLRCKNTRLIFTYIFHL